MTKRLIVALACAFTAACASSPDDYPSLAIRDAERVSGTLQPAEPYVPTPAAPEGPVKQLRLACEPNVVSGSSQSASREPAPMP